MTEGQPVRFDNAWGRDVLRIGRRIRRRVLAHTLEHGGGYMSQACSSAEVLATLYRGALRLGASVAPAVPRPFPGPPGPGRGDAFTGAGYNGPRSPELDRLYFSPVHYALVLYSALIEVGRMAPAGLDMFNRDGSTVELIGAEHSPGHEVTAGSLGQCLSQAAGAAWARRRKGETGRNVVFMSDGEFQEGQTWEAFAALSYHRLDNVLIYADMNGQQCDGAMETVMHIDPVAERLAAFGARVVEVDGHDPVALAAPTTLSPDGRPLVVLARTDPCRGLDLLRSRAPRLHYLRFISEEERSRYADALAALDEEGGA
ncbi:MAG: transketolase [Pseudomonadota bacterium]